MNARNPPVFLPTPASWPPETPAIADAVSMALADGSWGRYPSEHVTELERDLGKIARRDSVFCCASGNLALELTVRETLPRSGGCVLLAAYDYPGNFRAIEGAGGTPQSIDVVSNRWILDAETIELSLTADVKAVVVSHLHGLMADLPAIAELCQQRGIALIEDACQAIGGTIAGQPAGSFGTASIFSFGGSKLVTCGNGGAVLTNDPRLAQRLRVRLQRPGPAYSLSQLQAVSLRPQLHNLPARHLKRRTAARRLQAFIRTCADWRMPDLQPLDEDAGDYKFGWWVPAEKRDAIIEQASRMGLPLGAGFNVFKRIARTPIPHALSLAESIVVLDHRALPGEDAAFENLADCLRWLHDAVS